MIEILEQPESQHLRDVRVWLSLRERRCHLDGHLLIANRRFKRRLVGRQQPIDERLLVLLFPSHTREEPCRS